MLQKNKKEMCNYVFTVTWDFKIDAYNWRNIMSKITMTSILMRYITSNVRKGLKCGCQKNNVGYHYLKYQFRIDRSKLIPLRIIRELSQIMSRTKFITNYRIVQKMHYFYTKIIKLNICLMRALFQFEISLKKGIIAWNGPFP